MTTLTSETRVGQYALEIQINAPRAAVWQALVDETNAWWLPDFHMVGEGSVVSFDARAGGQLIETKPDGGSLLWYTVQMCAPQESLHLVGFCAPEWGGPATTMLRLKLEDTDGGTLLSVSDALVGRVTDESLESLRAGWLQLFTDGLKSFAERTQ
jgi:uncharacterized protein YndB with AHSA1/START domain